MRSCILIIIFFKYHFLIAQVENDTTKISNGKVTIGITAYPFTYNSKMNNGSIAVGPSILCGGRFSIQLGILCDFKLYKFPEYHGHVSSMDTVKYLNIFYPILFHYGFFVNQKTNLFLSAGVIFGGRFYLDENNYVRETSPISLIVGAGISYTILKGLYIKVAPTLRYSERISPGLLIDFSIKINEDKN